MRKSLTNSLSPLSSSWRLLLVSGKYCGHWSSVRILQLTRSLRSYRRIPVVTYSGEKQYSYKYEYIQWLGWRGGDICRHGTIECSYGMTHSSMIQFASIQYNTTRLHSNLNHTTQHNLIHFYSCNQNLSVETHFMCRFLSSPTHRYESRVLNIFKTKLSG